MNIIPEKPCFCAACHRKLRPDEVPEAVVVHPRPGPWDFVHTLHPDRRCFRIYQIIRPSGEPMPAYADPLTVAELEGVAGVRVVGSGDSRGYARLVPIRGEVAA
jgi:mono/diheme cytochrome c family protein